jgi:O-antigen ligase
MDASAPPPPAPYRRSISLTLACALAFLAALQALAFSFGPDYRNLGTSLGAPWLPRFIFASSAVAMFFLVALWWRMRRWALWGFLLVAAAQSITFLQLGQWRLTMLVLPALVGGAAAWNWARLR